MTISKLDGMNNGCVLNLDNIPSEYFLVIFSIEYSPNGNYSVNRSYIIDLTNKENPKCFGFLNSSEYGISMVDENYTITSSTFTATNMRWPSAYYVLGFK